MNYVLSIICLVSDPEGFWYLAWSIRTYRLDNKGIHTYNVSIMSASTINITLPTRLKEEIEKRVESGMYASVSEFIRNAVRNTLVSGVDLPYGQNFFSKAEDEILKAETQGLTGQFKTITSDKDVNDLFAR